VSRYRVIQTEFKDSSSLIQALQDLKLPFEHAEDLHSNTIHLVGYQGDRRAQKAAIVLRRGTGFTTSVSNDIGFFWNPEKQAYEAIVSDYDSGVQRVTEGMNKIHQRYTFRQLAKAAHLKGYTLREQPQPDGSLQVILVHR